MALPTGPSDHRKPKAIETRYKGFRFRSRLEARWAVFFDTLGVEYHYEPEGYELPDGTWYLPDFFLPAEDCYFEIKGPAPTDEDWNKAGQLAYATQKFVNILSGQVGDHTLSFARPKRDPDPELLRWLAAAPGEFQLRELVASYANRLVLPEPIVRAGLPFPGAPDFSNRVAAAMEPFVREERTNRRFYDLDFDSEQGRLVIWKVSFFESIGPLQKVQDERYGLWEWGAPNVYETLAWGSTMGGGQSYFGGPIDPSEIEKSRAYLNAITAARSARFEHGESPR